MIEPCFALHPKWVEREGVNAFLSPLQAAGMVGLEFTLYAQPGEGEPMRALAEDCARSGFHCNFHAPYQDPHNPAGFATDRREALQALFTPALAFAERIAAETGYAPGLVIHGAHGFTPLATLREDTRQFLLWVLEHTRACRVMLENLPPKPGTVRLGETPEQVAALVAQIDHPRLAICWDLGHSVLQKQHDLPPADFLGRTRHVHIHDINAAGEDHFPLVYGTVPWQRDLRALRAAGFSGAITMEINGYRASRLDNLHQRLADSFAAIREVLA